MTMAAVALITLSAFLHALWNFYSKASRAPRIFFLWTGLATVATGLVVFAVRPPALPPPVRVWVATSGLVHFAYWFCLSKAYSLGDISFVYPIARSAPGFIPLFAVLLLGETLSAQGVVGIAAILLSIYLLQQRQGGQTGADLLRYLRRPDSVWAFLTLGTVIAYSLIDKQGMALFHQSSSEDPVWRAVTYYLLQGIIAFPLYGAWVAFRFPGREIVRVGRQEARPILVSAALTLVSYSLILFVMMTEPVSYVAALRQCSVIFAVLLGRYALQEAHGPRRLLAALVMVAGMFLVATA